MAEQRSGILMEYYNAKALKKNLKAFAVWTCPRSGRRKSHQRLSRLSRDRYFEMINENRFLKERLNTFNCVFDSMIKTKEMSNPKDHFYQN